MNRLLTNDLQLPPGEEENSAENRITRSPSGTAAGRTYGQVRNIPCEVSLWPRPLSTECCDDLFVSLEMFF